MHSSGFHIGAAKAVRPLVVDVRKRAYDPHMPSTTYFLILQNPKADSCALDDLDTHGDGNEASDAPLPLGSEVEAGPSLGQNRLARSAWNGLEFKIKRSLEWFVDGCVRGNNIYMVGIDSEPGVFRNHVVADRTGPNDQYLPIPSPYFLRHPHSSCIPRSKMPATEHQVPPPIDSPAQDLLQSQVKVCTTCHSLVESAAVPSPPDSATVCARCREHNAPSRNGNYLPEGHVHCIDHDVPMLRQMPTSTPEAFATRCSRLEVPTCQGDVIMEALRPDSEVQAVQIQPTHSPVFDHKHALQLQLSIQTDVTPNHVDSFPVHTTTVSHQANNSRHLDRRSFLLDPLADITRIRMRSRTHRCLHPGATFRGTQKSGRNSYDVNVTIVDVDFASSFLCGYLRIRGLTDDWPELTTYFDAEIIGSRYGFLTRNWGANETEDMVHWSRFPAFRQVKNELRKPYLTIDDRDRGAVFMRWKERFLVPDHRVQDINGASFADTNNCLSRMSPSEPRPASNSAELEKDPTRNPVTSFAPAVLPRITIRTPLVGCGSDVGAHWYSLSTELNPWWPTYYVGQPALQAYWEGLFHKHGLEAHTQFNIIYKSAVWDADLQQYRIVLEDGVTGAKIETEARAIVFAIGGFTRAMYPPEIEGRDAFKGTIWHSAEWNHEYDLKGKRVGVIGNGCSVYVEHHVLRIVCANCLSRAQFLPKIAVDPSVQVVNFCRTPQWYIPQVDTGALAFRKENTFVVKQARKPSFRTLSDKHFNKIAPGCKRIIVDPGYLDAVQQPNVTLNWDGIDTIVEEGIKTKSGEVIELDAIIFGTGYAIVRRVSELILINR
ncbi:casein kinase [Salix suchowensis]|nr:casein kinase [Salix suchowensis]